MRVETEETYVPQYFYGVQKFITLTTDVMFLNGFPFFVTLSQNIRIFTVEFLLIHTAAQLSSYLTKVVKLYARGSFYIRTILMHQ